jgi:hypothetical protein
MQMMQITQSAALVRATQRETEPREIMYLYHKTDVRISNRGVLTSCRSKENIDDAANGDLLAREASRRSVEIVI